MAEQTKHDETVPGGKYVQGENYVNAGGEILGKVGTKKTATSESAFPEDFPGYEVLGQVEGMTPEKLKTMSDGQILEIKGIGAATLKQIRAL